MRFDRANIKIELPEDTDIHKLAPLYKSFTDEISREIINGAVTLHAYVTPENVTKEFRIALENLQNSGAHIDIEDLNGEKLKVYQLKNILELLPKDS